jgi:beta-galactosidase/beta-glucuronidase
MSGLRARISGVILSIVFTTIPFAVISAAKSEWQPAKGPLMTRWAKDVSPINAHPEYPRPQLTRESWLNLNGLWDYAIIPKEQSQPAVFQGQILVPFPVESALSGVMKHPGESNRIWYRRTFYVPPAWRNKHVLLHFGAVDWEAQVFINGKDAGLHRGGYDGFDFDITPALKGRTEEQEIVIAVWDPTDAGTQPRGKQVNRPHSIWYTPTSGIWQTVWLEPVSEAHIGSVKIVPDVDKSAVTITPSIVNAGIEHSVEVIIRDKVRMVYRATGTAGMTFHLPVKNPRLWSPDEPFLYDVKVTLKAGATTLDGVTSYFGMRKISVGKDDKGILRLFLNNKPLFQFGPLDQGFWPDGLYTAPTDAALRYDIEATKKLGFNMARKHVKIEPERWYYWCDKLGLLVWQDMPSGDRYIRARDPDIKRTEASAKQFELELKRLIEGRGNHPSIVMWVPFNEGWGQYDTERITKGVKNLDPSRLVDNTSGWADRGVGDVNDIHIYPGPGAPKPEPLRAGVLGEFGGLGLPVSGHTWQDEKNWGYRSYKTRAELTAAYVDLIRKLCPLIAEPGLAAAIYTQTTDVEIEVNGLMTYDRALIKMDEKAITGENRKVYARPAP